MHRVVMLISLFCILLKPDVRAQENIALLKGKLPCPLKYFVVYERKPSEQFSAGPSPEILFTTSDSTPVSVCSGIIKGVKFIPGVDWFIIVKNGDYIFTYGGFKTVLVHEGDTIKALDHIGTLSKQDEGYELRMQVWKGQQKLIAEEWLECTSVEKKARK